MKKLSVFIVGCMLSANLFGQASNCIDFVQNGTLLCDDFYLSNFANPVYDGCANSAPNGNPGIYNGVSNDSLNFNGANQQITIVGYGFLSQFDQVGFSVNGSPVFYLNGSFPIPSFYGFSMDLDLSTPNQGNWEYYTITISGQISSIVHESFESGITSLCSDDTAIEEECFNFTSFPEFYCGSFYLLNNPTTPLYDGCVNDDPFSGIYYGVGDIPFNFDGSNQQITMVGYGNLNQFYIMGFSINGGSTFYLDGSFPMTVGGVSVNLDTTTANVGGWEYYTITFSGVISTIIHNSVESGIVNVCAIDAQSAGIDDLQVTETVLFPNPANDVINVESSLQIEKIEIYSANGALLKSFNPMSTTQQISVDDLSTGTYFVNSVSANSISRLRFIKN